jgi:YHS domain-containing protein
MKFFNRKFLYLMTLVGIVAAFAACSRTESAVGINTDPNGLALRGFDAVAYFAVENAVKGDGKYEYVWNGAKWLFASEENMKKFQANPDMYAPQFGGYCSYAVSKGYTANGDPEAWKIVDGKLYLNYSPEVKKLWEQDQQKRIIEGEKNWTEFKTKKPEHKG